MKNKTLRMTVCIVSAVTCLSLAACSKEGKGEAEATPTPAVYTPVPVLNVTPGTDTPSALGTDPDATPTAGDPASTTSSVTPQGPLTVTLQYDGAPVEALSFQTSTVFQLTAVTSDGSKGGSWTSSDASSASVDENGVVTCWKAGNPKITYTQGNVSKSVSLTITEPRVRILFAGAVKTDITLNRTWGFGIDLVAEVDPVGSTVTWTTDDASVATVTEYGHVTGLRMGTTTVHARCGTADATCIVRITENPLNYVAPTPEADANKPRVVIVYWGVPNVDFTITVGSKVQMNYILYNIDQSTPVKWSIADPEYASVDANGVVTGLKATKYKSAYTPYTTLIATCGEYKCECIVRVKEPDNP